MELVRDDHYVKDDVNDVENDAARAWSQDSGKTIIMPTKDEDKLDKQWQDWEAMKLYDRRQSDMKSMELYGMNNKERYEKMKNRLNNTDIDNKEPEKDYSPTDKPVTEGVSLGFSEFCLKRLLDTDAFDSCLEELDIDKKDVPNMVNVVLKYSQNDELKARVVDSNILAEQVSDDYVDFRNIRYPASAKDAAEKWSTDSMYAIIKPRDNLEQLEIDWIKYNDMIDKRRRISDSKSIELFGIDNQTHYEFLKSKFLKHDIDTSLDNDEYNADISSSFIENTCKKIKASTNLLQVSEDCLKLISAPERTFIENLLIQDTLDGAIEMFKDNVCDIDDAYTKGDLPFYTPSELSGFGVFSGENNRYSAESDNDNIGDNISTMSWFKMYQEMFNGAYTENVGEYTSLWINKLNNLYYDYDAIKESGDIAKINARKQSILELGWNPNMDFNLENRMKASSRIIGILKEQYKDTMVLDISSFVEQCEEIAIDESAEDELKPIFLVFLKSNTIFNKVIKTVTKGPYGHVSMGFNPNLKSLYSYNVHNDGFSAESIATYHDVSNMKVFCVLTRRHVIEKLRGNIRHLKQTKTGYSLINLLTIPFNIDYKSSTNMVCSQFVDSMLKIAEMDFTGKSSALVSPKDIYSKIVRKKMVYKVYDGVIKNYNPKKVVSFIHGMINKLHKINESSNYNEEDYQKIYEVMIKPYYALELLKETKDFAVQFDEDGNLLIQKKDKLDFEAEYAKSHKLLLAYEKADNLEGIKYELCKLWFMNQLLEKKIYDKKTPKDEVLKCHKARAKILNDFNKYINLVASKDTSFNFVEYYEKTPFNDTKVRVSSNTLKYTIKYIKSVLLPH